jgi:hypothetical protein
MNEITELGKNFPEDLGIPYKNRWGHWVWRREDIPPDPSWPGIRPPTKTARPVLINGKWHWDVRQEELINE